MNVNAQLLENYGFNSLNGAINTDKEIIEDLNNLSFNSLNGAINTYPQFA